MDTEFVDVPEQHRFELRAGDQLVGFIDYRLTEVFADFSGQGHAATLARGALDDARTRGLAVRPSCPYVASYIDKHPDYADLVAS